MKKRLLSLLLVLVMVLGMLPATALAADEATEVSDQAGLAAMSSGSYKLTADIVLDSTWSAISTFSGTLDGNGHTVTLNGTPLIATLDTGSKIQNLILDGTVTSSSSVGSLANLARGATVRNCLSFADVTFTGSNGGWMPNYAAGLVGSMNSSSAVIENCVYAGTFTQGNAPVYGAISNNQFYVSGTVSNCIGVGSDRIGSTEGMSSHDAMAVGTNILIADPTAFSVDTYVQSLNNNRNADDGDLEWTVVSGKLALKQGAADPEATDAEIAALSDAITAAESAYSANKVYTASSYAAYLEALNSAKSIADAIGGGESKTGTVVVAATTKLTEAALTERTLSSVAAPTEIIEVDNTYFNNYMDSPKAGAYYKLTEDISVGSYWFGSFSTMNCTLDGNGHTITLSGSPLWQTIGENGVIQNLGILGSAQYSTNDTGAIAKDCSGLIVNCYSQATVTSAGQNNIIKNTGGLVANLLSGGAVVNCYVSGSVTAGGNTGSGTVGGIAGTSASNSMIKNCYSIHDPVVGSGAAILTGSAVKTAAQMKDTAFVDLLNSGKDTNGKTWTQSATGFPHLGEAEVYVPETPVEITFTSHDGEVTTFQSSDGISLDYADVKEEEGSAFAGTFSCEGATSWINLNNDSTNQILWIYDTGRVDFNTSEKYGTVMIRVGGDNGVITEFPLTVRQAGDVYGLRLVEDGSAVTDTLDVDGSEQIAFTVQVQDVQDGPWRTVPAGLVAFEATGSLSGSDGVYRATVPGSAIGIVKVSGLGHELTVTINSNYVAVESVKPAASGTYTVHGRNANSDGSGEFLDLMLDHGVGNVVVSPSNASYAADWTLTSSDPAVAEYVDAFLKAVLPKKAGTATLTATIIDKGADGNGSTAVSGSSEITIQYFNPVTSVTVDTSTALAVKEDEKADLPISFTGPKTADGYHVTEAGMVWTYSVDGVVEISRKGNAGVLVGTEDSAEYCVSNDQYQIVGLQAGTVTVTGTPVDTTGNAQSVVFTVTVTEGSAQTVDIDKIVKESIEGAQSWLGTNAPTEYAYGYEWEIFSLIRSGAAIPQSKLDAYLDSVETTYSNSPDSNATKPTTLARVALTLGVLGEDASDFRGIDFIEMLCKSSQIENTSNEAIFALLALDSKEYTVPSDATWTREALLEEILSYQNANGGFGLNDNETVSVDMTGMALQALAPYYTANDEVKAAVDKALTWLQGKMDSDCIFGGSAESTAQVLVALTALGKDPLDSANGFVKSSTRNLITAIDSFQEDNGGFRYGEEVNKMATVQSLYALEAYRRYAENENALYDLTDVTGLPSGGGSGTGGEDNKPQIADPVDVFVTISNAGNVVVAQQSITVKDVNENGKIDVDDALYAAHEKFYTGGAAAGYGSAYSSWGLGATKLWGDTSGAFGYWLNNASCSGLEDEVKEGDYLVAFVYQDQTSWKDTYSKFDKLTYTATAENALTVTLTKAAFDASWQLSFVAVTGATVTAYDENGKALAKDAYTVTDNGDGTYSIVFDAAGTYQVIATDATPIVPAVGTVTVSAKAAEPQNPTNPSTPGSSTDNPKTGDDTNIAFFIITMLGSVVCLAALLLTSKKKYADR